MRFDATERAAYARDGYVLRRRIFAAAELDDLRAAVEDVVTRVVTHAREPDAGPEMRLPDGHRLQFSSRTVIQWEWREGSPEVRLLRLHP